VEVVEKLLVKTFLCVEEKQKILGRNKEGGMVKSTTLLMTRIDG